MIRDRNQASFNFRLTHRQIQVLDHCAGLKHITRSQMLRALINRLDRELTSKGVVIGDQAKQEEPAREETEEELIAALDAPAVRVSNRAD